MKQLSPEKKQARKVSTLKRLVNLLNRKGDNAMTYGKEKRAQYYYETASRFEERLQLVMLPQ